MEIPAGTLLPRLANLLQTLGLRGFDCQTGDFFRPKQRRQALETWDQDFVDRDPKDRGRKDMRSELDLTVRETIELRMYLGRYRLDGDRKLTDVPVRTFDKHVAVERLKKIILFEQRDREGLIAPNAERDRRR